MVSIPVHRYQTLVSNFTCPGVVILLAERTPTLQHANRRTAQTKFPLDSWSSSLVENVSLVEFSSIWDRRFAWKSSIQYRDHYELTRKSSSRNNYVNLRAYWTSISSTPCFGREGVTGKISLLAVLPWAKDQIMLISKKRLFVVVQSKAMTWTGEFQPWNEIFERFSFQPSCFFVHPSPEGQRTLNSRNLCSLL